MPRMELSRRRVLVAGTGLLAAGRASAQAPVRMRSFWWGSKDRADRTFKANALFAAANPGVSVDGETLGWGDYWARLATQAAGRNLPDLLQMDYRYLVEYAGRGALLPLDSYMGKALAIGDFNQDSIDCGRVDGKLYAVNLGNNSLAMVYRQDAFEAGKLPPPDEKTSWDDFARLCAEATKAIGRDGFYASQDAGGLEQALECWLQQRGKVLYTAEGQPGFDAGDVGEWFGYWVRLRATRACVPADIQALDHGSLDTNPMTLNKAACAFVHTNELIALNALTGAKLGMTMYPQGAKPGQYLKPAMLWSVSASSKNPEAAVRLANFFVESPEGVRAVGVERGVPASPAMREAVKPDLAPLERTMVDFVGFIADKVGKLPPAPPRGAGEVSVLLLRANQEVGFGRVKAPDGGRQFVADAKAILSRG